jgi:hypothetical protein
MAKYRKQEDRRDLHHHHHRRRSRGKHLGMLLASFIAKLLMEVQLAMKKRGESKKLMLYHIEGQMQEFQGHK